MATPSAQETMPIKLNFGGGLEKYFSNKRDQTIQVPRTDSTGAPANAAFLVKYIHEHAMQYNGEPKNDPLVTPEGEV